MNTHHNIQSSIVYTAIFVVILWCIKSAEQLFGISFRELGVYPQELPGLVGVFFAPFIHGSFEHLASNTLPLLILGTVLLYGYPRSRYYAIAAIWLVSGLGVWLLGREAWHVGASGLTHGMFFYLLLSSILRRDKRSIALMMIAFFMYGGMVMTIFPREEHISFEYHLFGAVTGAICAFLFYKWDPKPELVRYPWENPTEPDEPEGHWMPGGTSNTTNSGWAGDTEESVEEDLIGDEWMTSQQREHNARQSEESNGVFDNSQNDNSQKDDSQNGNSRLH